MITNKSIKKESKLFYYFQFVIDVLIILLGYYLTIKIFFTSAFEINKQFNILNNIFPYIIIVSMVLIYIYETYKVGEKQYIETMYSVLILLIFVQISTMSISFFTRDFGFARSIFFISFLIQFFFFLIYKFLIYKVYWKINSTKKIMFIYNKVKNDDIIRKIERHERYEIKYHVERIDEEKIGKVDMLVIDEKVDIVIKKKAIRRAFELNKSVFVIPDFFDIALHKAKLNHVDDVLMFEVENFCLSVEQSIIKRIMDIIISVILLVFTSPLFLITVIVIKLFDNGPVFFKQERITQGNKKFILYKFRSMIVDAEIESGPMLAKNNDDRITNVGKFIRATRLDELPQLYNVFKGDMSIVGPRPERAFFVDKFVDEIDKYKYRFNVKAGITGMAQVYGKYSTSAEEKLRYDLMYIKEYSLLMDIELIIKTLKVVLMKVGA